MLCCQSSCSDILTFLFCLPLFWTCVSDFPPPPHRKSVRLLLNSLKRSIKAYTYVGKLLYSINYYFFFLQKSNIMPDVMTCYRNFLCIFFFCSGIHHKGKCNADELINQLDKVVASSTDYLFPDTLSKTPMTRSLYRKMSKPNGGWGDVRDHTLCMAYGKSDSAHLVLWWK